MHLRDALLQAFHWSYDDPRDDARFNDLALRVFEQQFRNNPPYAAYCRRREVSPATVAHWSDVPPLPTAAFKEVPLLTGEQGAAQRVFRTSGTTRGAEGRGEHHVLDVSLYTASLLASFEACVLPDGARPPMVSLMPAAAELPDSSLAFMIDAVMHAFGASGSGTFASTTRGIDDAALHDLLADAVNAAQPVCILGTSLAFVHWLEMLEARNRTYALPAGSRIMDTGGVKGSGRAFDEDGLKVRYSSMLGVATSHCINEYGMTEMCSQFYDATLRDAVNAHTASPRKLVPPWVRTRVVDPQTLDPMPAGEVGILQHFDLANANSVMAIQTEDLAVADGEGFRLLGRAPGATPRGCSIAMDLLLQGIGRR